MKKSYMCPFCRKKFPTRVAVRKHRFKDHSVRLSPEIMVTPIVSWAMMAQMRREAVQR